MEVDTLIVLVLLLYLLGDTLNRNWFVDHHSCLLRWELGIVVLEGAKAVDHTCQVLVALLQHVDLVVEFVDLGV